MAQPGSAVGSYPTGRRFKSDSRNFKSKTMKTKILSLALIVAVALPVFAGSEDLPTFNAAVHSATAPSNGTNELQTLTFGATITGGTFKLKFDQKTTAAITWSSTNGTLVSNIDTAMEALATVGTGGVTTTAGTISSGANGTVTITFTGNRAKQNVPAITVADNSMTGAAHTLTVGQTTAGVEADGRILAKGTLCVADDTGYIYQNTGTPPLPTWTLLPSRTLATITGDGAITIANGIVTLTKGSAAAITLAAPSSQDGTRITVQSNSDFAHVITCPSAIILDGTTGANTTATFAAFKGASITLVASGVTWLVESSNLVTCAP